jgi:hypothetical protein
VAYPFIRGPKPLFIWCSSHPHFQVASHGACPGGVGVAPVNFPGKFTFFGGILLKNGGFMGLKCDLLGFKCDLLGFKFGITF